MRLIFFPLLCLITIFASLLMFSMVSIPYSGVSVLVEPLLRIKLAVNLSSDFYPYLVLFLFSLSSLYSATLKRLGSILEIIFIALGILSFLSSNLLTFFIASIVMIWVSAYSMAQKNEPGVILVRAYLAALVGFLLASFALISYMAFVTYGHINLSSELYVQLVLKQSPYYQILFWFIPTIYFVGHINIAPFSWLLRPMIDEFNSRQLAIYQIVSFSYLYNWLKNYIFPLLDNGVLEIRMILLWGLTAILAYQLLAILSSMRLRELLYSYVGYLVVLFFMIVLLEHGKSSRIAIWGYACVVLSTSLIGLVVNMLDHYFGSNSIATIINSSKYSRNFMRYILLLFMVLMAIPGSINFVFIYSSIAQAFIKDIMLGSVILTLWVGMVVIMIMKMSYVIIHTNSAVNSMCISKSWYLKIGLVSIVIYICGLIPSIL